MAQRTVNERQLEVLEWIVSGCPDRSWPDTTYKTVAVALQNRRLAKVSKKRGVWRVEPTDAGRHFVKHGTYPPGHWATPDQQAGSSRPPLPSLPTRERRVTAKRPVDQMLDDIATAMADPDGLGGFAIDDEERGYFSNLARAAERYGKVPAGKQITEERIKVSSEGYFGKYKWVLKVVDQPAWMTRELKPIPVPQRLGKSTPRPVRELAAASRLRMKPAVRARALRVLNALALEASRRGYDVVAPATKPGYSVPQGHLTIRIQGHAETVTIDELNDRVPHVPTAKELREKERYSWTRIPTHDDVPSGRLRLRLNGWSNFPTSFEDRKTIVLEDRLPRILQSLELRAAEAEERRLARARAEEERRAEWERVRAQAVTRLEEHHRVEVLRGQMERWAEAERIGQFADALEARIADAGESGARAAAEEWLKWMRHRQEQLDPFNDAIAVPRAPEPTPSALQPFMAGLSPYGPS